MQVIELPEEKFEPMTIAFSPDGRLLAAWAWGRACVLDTASGAVRGCYGEKTIALLGLPGVGFTADGRAVVVHRYGGRSVAVYDLESGAAVRMAPEDCDRAVEVGPGGRLVYLAHRPGEGTIEVVRWDPLTGESLPPFGRHKGYLRTLAISADEKWVAGATGDTIRVWNLGGPKLPTRAVRQFQTGSTNVISGLALSSDGEFVAYNGPGLGAGRVPTGEKWEVAVSGPPHSRAVAFHPARPVLACSTGADLVLYDAAARAELNRYAWGPEKVTTTAFSPDGLRCAAAAKGRVVIWDVDV